MDEDGRSRSSSMKDGIEERSMQNLKISRCNKIMKGD